MNGLRVLIADADPAGLPAPLLVLKILLLFTFVLHLVFMNVVVGGSAVWLWANWKARRTRTPYRALASTIGRALPVATAFAITTGVAPLLFTQLLYGQLFYTSSVLMAWSWLSVVPLLLAAYYAHYAVVSVQPGTNKALALGVASVASLAAIAFLFSNNMTLMLRPEHHLPMYLEGDRGLHLNLGDWWLWPRLLHMLVGSVAVTGLFVAWRARLTRLRDDATGAWLQRFGATLFMAATLVEFGVGIALFAMLPVPVREVFWSGLTPDPILLVAGILFGLGAVVVARRSLVLASTGAIIAIADMAVVRHRVRQVLLEPYFQVEARPVEPQTGALILFVVLLLAGLLLVAWMVWRFVSARPARAETDAPMPV